MLQKKIPALFLIQVDKNNAVIKYSGIVFYKDLKNTPPASKDDLICTK